MPLEPPVFQFRSDLFAVDPGEDENTNPFCYGRELAEWVKEKFEALGYSPEPVIAEDWGYCVMLKRHPFMLWIGCGNVRSDLLESVPPEHKHAFVPDGARLTWSCLVGTDVLPWTPFFWKRLLGRASTQPDVNVVLSQLERMLRNEPRIRLIDDIAPSVNGDDA